MALPEAFAFGYSVVKVQRPTNEGTVTQISPPLIFVGLHEGGHVVPRSHDYSWHLSACFTQVISAKTTSKTICRAAEAEPTPHA